jgi:hypothetical protein
MRPTLELPYFLILVGIGIKERENRQSKHAEHQEAAATPLTNTSSSLVATVSTSPKEKTRRSGSDSSMRQIEQHRRTSPRYGDGRPPDGINRTSVLPNSTHRHGSIYSITQGWHQDYRISDTNEIK